MRIIAIYICFALSSSVRASCLEIIRDHLSVEKNSIPLFQYVMKDFRYKLYKAENSISINIPSKTPSRKAEYIKEYIESFEVNTHRKNILELIPRTYADKDLILHWLHGLARDLTRKTFKEGSSLQIELLTRSGKIDRLFLEQVIKERLSKYGFQNSTYVHVRGELNQKDFGDILSNRNLILDEGFAKSDHGVFIHILQLDLISFAMKKEGLRPQSLGELYEWIGKNETTYLPQNDKTFGSLTDIWDVYFDSFTWDITSPEIFNPIIENYLGLKQSGF